MLNYVISRSLFHFFSNQGIILKRLLQITLVLVLVLSAANAYTKAYQAKKRVGECEVEVKLDRNPPSLGDNNIKIEIRDGEGRSVTEAKVLVNYIICRQCPEWHP